VNTPKKNASTATMVEPTGVFPRMEIAIPRTAHTTDRMAEQMVTDLKLLYTLMLESAGKITSAEISREPTRFIARTIITAIITAIKKLYNLTFVPADIAKFSSKVTAKILLYKKMKIATTMMESTTHSRTSLLLSVKIEVEPKRVTQTSPDRFDEVEKMFKSR